MPSGGGRGPAVHRKSTRCSCSVHGRFAGRSPPVATVSAGRTNAIPERPPWWAVRRPPPRRLVPSTADREASKPVRPDMIPKTVETSPRPRRRVAQVAALSIVAAALLAACSSSSTSTTTTAPSGGTLSSTNAAYIASDLKAPAGSLTGAGSTFVQPFFTKAFYTYTSLNSGLQVNYSAVGSGTGISDFQSGSVTFAASDVPMSSSDLAKVPASSGP